MEHWEYKKRLLLKYPIFPHSLFLQFHDGNFCLIWTIILTKCTRKLVCRKKDNVTNILKNQDFPFFSADCPKGKEEEEIEIVRRIVSFYSICTLIIGSHFYWCCVKLVRYNYHLTCTWNREIVPNIHSFFSVAAWMFVHNTQTERKYSVANILVNFMYCLYNRKTAIWKHEWAMPRIDIKSRNTKETMLMLLWISVFSRTKCCLCT